MVFVVLPLTTQLFKVSVSRCQINRVEHILQETAAQVWLCQYFAFMIGDEFYLIVDEAEAAQILTQSISLNLQASGIDNAKVENIKFSTVARFSKSDLSIWNIPLVSMEASLTDHKGSDIIAAYDYEMAPEPVHFKEDGIYQ